MSANNFDIGWVFGEFQYEKQLIVFPSEASVGGYQCSYCSAKFGKRWDALRTHIKKYHQDVCDEEITDLHNRISKIAVRCKFCHVPQIKTGIKLRKHEDECKEVYDEKMNQSLEQDIVVQGEELETRNKRKIIEVPNSLWEKIKTPIEQAIEDAIDENRDVIKKLQDKVDEQNKEIEEKNSKIVELEELVRKYEDEVQMKDKIDDEKSGRLIELEELVREYKDEKQMNVKVDEEKSQKIIELENSVKKVVDEVKFLKVEIKKTSKLENLNPQKVKNEQKIGEGTFGQIFKAEYDGKMIALKKMKLHWTSFKEMLIQVKTNSPNLMSSQMIGLYWATK